MQTPFIIGLFLLMALLHPMPAHSNDTLFTAIGARLGHMKAVAHYKFIQQRPIEDLSREAVVIKDAERAGHSLGLPAAPTRRFFATQITAAKIIQQYWFEQWRANPPSPNPPSLTQDIRPKLLHLGNEIMRALTSPIDSRDRQSFLQHTQTEGLPEALQNQLFDELRNLSTFGKDLQRIQAAGVLRVGTTLDYPPFSSGTLDQPRGIDITLAKRLGDTLGVTVRFVQTSWPTLTQDFTARAFDLAISGVSITPSRAALGTFSAPYHIGGKTPIGRCLDQDRFKDFAAIDQPETRVVFNPGGTNERFARQHLQHAQFITFPDNRFIFQELLAGRADVMFTDEIEVALKTRLHRPLCALLPGQRLTYQEKAIWLHKDDALKQSIDDWLQTITTDGSLKALFDEALGR
jgi:cyclohexadienyl dehydratase